MTVEIEVPDLEMVEDITDLWVDLAREQREFNSNLLAEQNRESIRDTFAHHIVSNELLIARTDTEIVGFITFTMEVRLYLVSIDRGYVHNLFVQSEDRNQGIGTILLREAEARLRERGAKIICLEALALNEAANTFYRENGYSPHRIEFTKKLE